MRTIQLQTTKHLTFHIRMMGTGGNGSYFFRNLLQMIRGYIDSDNSTRFNVGIADGDKVEEKNLRNQLFTDEDVYEHKTSALIDRYANHYDVDVRDYPHYVTSIEQLQELFNIPEDSSNRKTIPVLIGMVDNDRTRQLFHEYFYRNDVSDLIWIDLGIEDTDIIAIPSQEEQKRLQTIGFSGQCVIGLKWKGEIVLPPVTDVYENILLAEDVFPGMSCGDILPSNPQRMITNQTAAHIASMIVNTLFFTKSIMVSEINFNAQLGHIKPTYITKEQYEHFEALNSSENIYSEVRV